QLTVNQLVVGSIPTAGAIQSLDTQAKRASPLGFAFCVFQSATLVSRRTIALCAARRPGQVRVQNRFSSAPAVLVRKIRKTARKCNPRAVAPVSKPVGLIR
ncbi:hypothetical protein KBY26_18620, partial [Ruegeria pomeroyi]|nr:hypothetical protein [Ruegeria pomeroyi]